MSDKILIAYFSASGVTKRISEELSKMFQTDLFEIQPEIAYTHQDLDWHEKKSRSSIEMNNKECRPKVANKISDIKKYDTILLGFPIWWYEAPKIINTFIESYDLEKIKVIPFCTSGGSSIKSSEDALKRQYPDINWKTGKRLTGKETVKECENWINKEDN